MSKDIPCLGYRDDYNGDYDCEYPHAGEFGCEDCICNDGRFDPRTGKEYSSHLVPQI